MASLVLAAHGSLTHPGAARSTFDHADRLQDTGSFEAVRPAFWKEAPTFREALRTVPDGPIYVVPLFTSEGYFTRRVLPRELRLTGEEPLDVDGPVELTDPVGTHPAMTDVIITRAERLVDGPLDEVGLAVVGHGTERSETSAAATRAHADRIRARGRFAAVDALFLDQAPHVHVVYERLDTRRIVVVPYFVADGEHTTEDIPAALGVAGPTEGAASVDGRIVHYAGAVGTDPAVVDVILDRVAAAGCEVVDGGGLMRAGSNLGAPERAFLEWVEEAVDSDGWRTWGQLAIDRSGDGFECRHVEDVGVAGDALEDLEGTRALRERCRFDDDGAFRPLATAATLPSGWRLAGVDGEAVIESVGWIYPATIPNWYRDRHGALDVTHWSAATQRHTGRYGDIGELESEDIVDLVETHCVDGACVKRREWDVDADRPIEVPGGDGAFPCREACPYLLEAARARLDGELAAGARFDPLDR